MLINLSIILLSTILTVIYADTNPNYIKSTVCSLLNSCSLFIIDMQKRTKVIIATLLVMLPPFYSVLVLYVNIDVNSAVIVCKYYYCHI